MSKSYNNNIPCCTLELKSIIAVSVIGVLQRDAASEELAGYLKELGYE